MTNRARKGDFLIAIVGPTAVGKSALALALAREIEAEILSVDSMQIYKEMDIGTDKPPLKVREEIPHHMIDIITPDRNFSVAEFQKLAREAIKDILKRGKKVIITGGSGLYFRAVVDPLIFPKGTLDSSLRKQLEEKANSGEVDLLYQELLRLDPEVEKFLPLNDVRRVIRALEIVKTENILYSNLRKGWSRYESIYNLKVFGLTCNREKLYRRIDNRVEKMLKNGLLMEVKDILKKYNLATTPSQALGYKELIAYLRGEITLGNAVKLIKQRTRHFAKRQIVWFKADPRVNWVDVGQLGSFDEVLSYSLSLIYSECGQN